MEVLTDNDLPGVSIVVIGHNEGGNLEQCFGAINKMDYPREKLEVIFIDSKSTDNSADIAKKFADKVFSVRSHWPTAGEAFNKGIVESSQNYVHITAGDIQLHPDYLRKAVSTLAIRDDIHAVTGYFEEKEPKGWNKILAYRREEDKTKDDHFVSTPNGGTFKKSAFFIVNGYDERIKKGQETELGKRFAENGLKIWYMHLPQGLHDFELQTFSQMAMRSFNNGFSLGHLFLLSLQVKDNKNLKSFTRYAIKTIIFNSIFVLAFFVALFFSVYFSFVVIALYLLYFPAMIFIRKSDKTMKHKLYFLVMGYFGIFNFFGILNFLVKGLYYKMTIKGFFHERRGLNA
ncbi:MAG: glycosyltransferase [Bacteroidales bacterium]|nr:glycosyltransferase [Bacteroidales bacterium]MCF8402537.1 glycosyltransferase [Bacteroidales bacterium]